MGATDVYLGLLHILGEVVERGEEPVERGVGVEPHDLRVVGGEPVGLVGPCQIELGVGGAGVGSPGEHLDGIEVAPLNAYAVVAHHGHGEHGVRAAEVGGAGVSLVGPVLVALVQQPVCVRECAVPRIEFTLGLGPGEPVDAGLHGLLGRAAEGLHHGRPRHDALLVAHVHTVLVPSGGLDQVRRYPAQSILIGHPDAQEQVPVPGDGR